MTPCWLVTSLPTYLKSIGLRIDHTQVQKIEMQCCSVTQTNDDHIFVFYTLFNHNDYSYSEGLIIDIIYKVTLR